MRNRQAQRPDGTRYFLSRLLLPDPNPTGGNPGGRSRVRPRLRMAGRPRAVRPPQVRPQALGRAGRAQEEGQRPEGWVRGGKETPVPLAEQQVHTVLRRYLAATWF